MRGRRFTCLLPEGAVAILVGNRDVSKGRGRLPRLVGRLEPDGADASNGRGAQQR